MMNDAVKSVLIIDDNPGFPDTLADQLKEIGYHVELKNTINGSLKYLETGQPNIIVADRNLGGSKIEDSGLSKIRAKAPRAFIVVYSVAEKAFEESRFEIHRKGAVRVWNRGEAQMLAGDLNKLQSELRELETISLAIKKATRERDKFISVLLGSKVKVSIIDRAYQCWYRNYGSSITETDTAEYSGPCWECFRASPPSSGPCSDCPIDEILNSNQTEQESLCLLGNQDWSVNWVYRRSMPLFADDSDQKPVAVLNTLTDVPLELIKSLGCQERLMKVVQGLVHFGFMRVRIHTVIQGTNTTLVAAWANTGQPRGGGDYFRDIRNRPQDYSKCDYVQKAVNGNKGILVTQAMWDIKESAIARAFGLIPPYIVMPVFNDRKMLEAIMCLDFVRDGKLASEAVINKFVADSERTIRWLENTFCKEVREACCSKKESNNEIKKRYQAVLEAKLGVGQAISLEETEKAIVQAFKKLLPKDCGVSVRVLSDTKLKIYEGLHWPEEFRMVGRDAIEITDQVAIAAYIATTGQPIWIDNYADYRNKAKDNGLPIGLIDPSMASSIASIPLKLEGVVRGTLCIYAKEPIRWKIENYSKPILSLAQLTALTVRDLVLYGTIEAGRATQASLAAFNTALSNDALWGHWARNRIAELQGKRFRVKLLADRLQSSPEKEELLNIFEESRQLITQILKGSPPGVEIAECELFSDIFKPLQNSYREVANILNFKYSANPIQISAPAYHVRMILRILIDNAFESFKRSSDQLQLINIVPTINADSVRIEVVDDGPGISQEIRIKLFREPIKSKPGHGVGLLIAKGAAKSVGGDLVYEFLGKGQGTKFVLILPLIGNSIDEKASNSEE